MNCVSIVMTAFNAASTIERAVRSVFAQSDPNWQLIVVDDGSTDDTANILRNLEKELADPRLKLVLGYPNSGPAAARNRGLSQVTGDWVTFLDSDDEFKADRIALGRQAITCPDIDMVICRHEIITMDKNSAIRGLAKDTVLSGAQVAQLILTEDATSYVWDKMFRLSCVSEITFPPLRRAEDKVYAVAAAVSARLVKVIADPLIVYHVAPTSLTWSRVSSTAETETLEDLLAKATWPLMRVNGLRRSLHISRVLAFLAVAHQNIFLNKSPAYLKDRFTWLDIAATVAAKPVFGLAGALFKFSPALYEKFYRRYAASRYGLVFS